MARIYIGKELRELREKAALTQTAFAEALGVHWRSVQNWEADITSVDTYKAESLLKKAGTFSRRRTAKKGGPR